MSKFLLQMHSPHGKKADKCFNYSTDGTENFGLQIVIFALEAGLDGDDRTSSPTKSPDEKMPGTAL